MSKKKSRTSSVSSRLRSKPKSASPLPDELDFFAPLSSLTSDHEALASAAISFVGWKNVLPMLPPCLQGHSRDDVIQLVTDELDGMSKRRIARMLQGERVPTSSSSSELSDEKDEEKEERSGLHDSIDNSPASPKRSPRSLLAEKLMRSCSSSSEYEDSTDEPEEKTYSDIELVEGYDGDSSILPDVTED